MTQTTYTAAMDKLRDEMAKNSARYVQIVGEYLTDYLLKHPEIETAILAKDKTIKGSLKAMEAEAGKHREGSVGILDDATAFRIVLEYFGVKAAPDAPRAEPNVPAPDPFDLDALMGGAL